MALLLPACLAQAWAGAGGAALWHVRVFLSLKVRRPPSDSACTAPNHVFC